MRGAGTPVGPRGRHRGHRSGRFQRVQRGNQRQCPVRRERPVPVGRANRYHARGSIGCVSALGRPPRIQVPRWVQLVGLPLLLVLAWILLTAASHVVFLFLVAALVALLLDPLVRALQKARLPRGLSVALVFLTFASMLALVILAIATQSSARRRRLPTDSTTTSRIVSRRPDRPRPTATSIVSSCG